MTAFAIIPSRFRPSESHLDTCGRGWAAPCSTLPGDRQATNKPVNAPTDYHRKLRFHSDLVPLISSTAQDMTLGPSHHIDSSFRLFVLFPLAVVFLDKLPGARSRVYTPTWAERRTLASACLAVESLVQCQALHAMPVNVRYQPLLPLLAMDWQPKQPSIVVFKGLLSKEAHTCGSRSTRLLLLLSFLFFFYFFYFFYFIFFTCHSCQLLHFT
ncbi:hypothetical protein B0T13DRAFT_139557 [Neurospora crassa]|nr:hypothetical protein B0T13DRAFT_139557 [Neurospora crassa]